MTDDPMVRGMVRETVGLRAGGVPSEHLVRATYVSSEGKEVFAFCRDGLLIEPRGQQRFIPYGEICQRGLLNLDNIMAAKDEDAPLPRRKLTLRLRSGETLDLSVDGWSDDSLGDLIKIARLIERRIASDRSFRARRSDDRDAGATV